MGGCEWAGVGVAGAWLVRGWCVAGASVARAGCGRVWEVVGRCERVWADWEPDERVDLGAGRKGRGGVG